MSMNPSDQLLAAAGAGDLAAVTRALADGANANHADSDGSTALLWAAQEGYATMVEALLAAGANVNHVDSHSTTALRLAARHGHAVIIETLLVASADVNHADQHGFTALQWAAKHRHLAIVDKLLAAGATVNPGDRYVGAALVQAAQNSLTALADKLLAAGADVNHIENGGDTALLWAAKHGHAVIVDRLLVAGANPNHANRNGSTALLWAARHGHTAIVQVLLAFGAALDLVDNDGDSALICAARGGHEDVALFLINAGADPFIHNKNGQTAADEFKQKGNQAIEQLLAEYEVSPALFFSAVARNDLRAVGHFLDVVGVGCRGEQGRTPLHVVAQHGKAEVAQILFSRGASLTARDHGGQTPLHLACACGDMDVVTFLLTRRAPTTLADEKGFVPVDVAATCGRLDIVRVLVDSGASLQNVAYDGRTILHHAVTSRNAALIQYLLPQDSVNVNAVDATGSTPLHYAVRSMTTSKETDRADLLRWFSTEDSQLAILQVLLASNRIDLNVPNHDGETPLLVALRSGERDAAAVVTILIKSGADVNTQNLKRESALLVATKRGDATAVRLLLANGARTDVADNAGRTPLSVAASTDIRAVVQVYHNSQQYHDRCLALLSDRASPLPTPTQVTELVPLVTSVFDLRLMLTLVALSGEDVATRSNVLTAAFDHVVATKLTFDDDACVFFKLVLERCEREKLLSREAFLLFDRKAEKANNENADWVIDMKKQVATYSWRLETHETHLQSIVSGVKHVHTMVMENRNAIVATVRHVERGLAHADAKIQHVAMHLAAFRDAYVDRLAQEDKIQRMKMVCGVVASVAGFVIGPVLKEISDAVVDFANPVEVVTKIYGEKDTALFLAEQSKKVLSEVIRSQLEKFAIPPDEFELLLRENIALLHPEIVAECEARGLVVHLDLNGGRSGKRSVDMVKILHGLDDATRPDVTDQADPACREEVIETVGPATSSRQSIDSEAALVVDKQTRLSNQSRAFKPKTAEQLPTPVAASSSSPLHAAVQQSGGEVSVFENLLRSLSDTDTSATTRAEVQLRTTRTSREKLCAAQYAYALGHSAVGDYLTSLMINSPTSSLFDTSLAVSVELVEAADAFAFICIVIECQGDVDECAYLCEVMDEHEHTLDETIEADVVRDSVETVEWSAVELACHLGYVAVVKYMLKEMCKGMPPKEKIALAKRARERAANAGAAA